MTITKAIKKDMKEDLEELKTLRNKFQRQMEGLNRFIKEFEEVIE